MTEGFPQVEQASKQEFLKLDLSKQEFTDALAQAPVYRKSAVITARPAIAGEEIKTVTPEGVEEGRNVAEDGDVVLTNTVGASFILKGDNFAKRYEATENEGEYRAKGMARIIDNPTASPIEIMAPWGEPQHGAADALIATVFDPEHPDEIGEDRYLLDRSDFVDTYQLVTER